MYLKFCVLICCLLTWQLGFGQQQQLNLPTIPINVSVQDFRQAKTFGEILPDSLYPPGDIVFCNHIIDVQYVSDSTFTRINNLGVQFTAFTLEYFEPAQAGDTFLFRELSCWSNAQWRGYRYPNVLVQIVP